MRYNVWVEKLTVFEMIFRKIQSFFLKITVYYDENNVSAGAKNMIEKPGWHSFFMNFYPAHLAFGLIDQEGLAVNYRCNRNLTECLEEFVGQDISAEEGRVKNTLNQYIAGHLLGRFIFITMLEERPEFRDKDRGTYNVIHLAKRPLNKFIRRQYAKYGYVFSEPFICVEWLRYLFQPFSNMARIFLSSKIFYNAECATAVRSKSAVFIEFSPGASLDFAFWKNGIDPGRFDIVYYLDRKDDPALSQVEHIMRERGSKCVDLHFRNFVKIANLSGKQIKDLFLALPWVLKWENIYKFEYKMWFLLYQAVFLKFKAKIIMQYQEFSWIQEPQARAIESAGGIMVGFHWSNYPILGQPILFPMHVLFVWGKRMHDYFQKSGNTCKYILPSGFWITDDANHYPAAKDFYNKSKFVLAIMDNNVSYISNYDITTLTTFYTGVLQLFENNPDWTGIIKSRIFDTQYVHPIYEGAEFWPRLKRLIDDKRIIVLPRTASPSVASVNAHLTLCYGISSPGIIAGIYGCSAIHWDASGYLLYPMYKDKDQKVVYSDFNEFIDAVIKFSRGDSSIGDFSRYRKYFNCFDDLNAQVRVGKFINSFLEKSSHITDAQEVLSTIAQEYMADNKLDKSFFIPDNWWDNVACDDESVFMPCQKK